MSGEAAQLIELRAVEKYMFGHDEKMVDDHTDDINTLLVFVSVMQSHGVC